MNAIKMSLVLLVAGTLVRAGEIKILRAHGDVSVRHNVQEEWVKAAAADVLKPDDSMRSGKGSGATILAENGKRIEVPELVVVDVADLRQLSREELLLKLATDRILNAPPQKEGSSPILKTTTEVGANMDEAVAPRSANSGLGRLQLNGTRLLYHNGYYATCALKTKDLLRLFPDLTADMDARIMIADALEKMQLKGEAQGEYLAISKS